MKIIFTLATTLFVSTLIHAQTVVYDIPIGQTIGLTQTSGDICSAPFTIEEAHQTTQGNTWGFTWTSTNTGMATSVEIELGFTWTDGGGTFPTTLNGSSSFNVMDGTFKNCEASTLMSWSVDPTAYISGGTNTFLVDFATAVNISQVDNLPYAGDPFFRVTVDYTPCPAIDTTVDQSFNTLSSTATNATYQWLDCASGMIIPGATMSTYTASMTGSYAVIITDITTGCSDTSGCHDVIISGMNDYSGGVIEVYPNPVYEYISADFSQLTGSVDLVITDLQGRKVLNQTYNVVDGSQVNLNVKKLIAGHYILSAISEQKLYIARFVKE